MSATGRVEAAPGALAPSAWTELRAVLRRGQDLLALTKPRVVVAISAVTAAGYWQASGGRDLDLGRLALTVLANALAGGGALGLNQVVESDLDARMERTRGRPVVAGRLTAREALAFSVLLVVSGLLALSLLVDATAGLITAVTVASYVFAYTPLKRRSALATVVGAVPGALPPVTGWAAATGGLEPGAWALFGILFFWQLPHSLAIARLYREDYRRAGMKLLPVVDTGGGSTGRHAVLNALGLLGASFLPAFVGIAGSAYLLAAIVLGLGLLWLSVRMAIDDSTSSARALFRGSLAYMPALLLALALDRVPR